MTLIQILRDGSLHKAEDLSKRTGVSLRTIYRDMDTLAASGVPIEGERGVGYRVMAAITLPPLNLTMTEVEALHLGLMAVSRSNDPDLTRAANDLARKLDSVLPEDPSKAPEGFNLAVYPFADAARGFQHLPSIRQAIRTRQKLSVRLDGATLVLRPLQLDYWGRLWTCVAWCETTQGFSDLRVDQVSDLRILPGLFVDEPDKSYATYLRQKELQSQSATDRTMGRK